jgi:Ulp1 family protease
VRIVVLQFKKYHSWALRLPRTYIYTFDSLASKHPQAVKRLSKYLLMEAHDKRQLDEATLNEPKGMQAIVGIQLVYCEVRVGFSYFSGTPSTQLL